MRAVWLTEEDLEEIKDLEIGMLIDTPEAYEDFCNLSSAVRDGEVTGEYFYRMTENYFRDLCPDVKPLGLVEAERKEALEAFRKALTALDDEYLTLVTAEQVERSLAGITSLIQEITRKLRE